MKWLRKKVRGIGRGIKKAFRGIGGGFKKGYVHGETDAFGYKAVKDIVNVGDLHATMLQALGLDHRKLTFPFGGRLDSLTDPDVTGARVIPELLA